MDINARRLIHGFMTIITSSIFELPSTPLTSFYIVLYHLETRSGKMIDVSTPPFSLSQIELIHG